MAILPGSRIRQNSIFGTVADDPLTIGATSFNSAGLASFGVVSGNHAIATLDPLKTNGNPEIIMITAHTGSATVATIQRGMFGTSAREHPSGTLWVHAAIGTDFIEVLTSGTRPSDQYEGQFIFETDTNKLVGFDGAGWAPRDAGGTIGFTAHTVDYTLTTSLTDVVAVEVTTVANRQYKITGHVHGNLQAASYVINAVLVEGATVFSTDRIDSEGFSIVSGALHMEAIVSPSPGLHTYKVRASTSPTTGGSGNISDLSSGPGFILVEDTGAV